MKLEVVGYSVDQYCLVIAFLFYYLSLSYGVQEVDF